MAKWGEGDPRWIVEERPDATNVNNWHWTEKNATPWSKDRIKQLFDNFKIAENDLECLITEIDKIEGEATANNRKGKLIFFYEWNIILKWIGKLPGISDEYKGKITIPNLSEENDLDDIEITITVDESNTNSEKLKLFMYNIGRDKIRKQLGKYIKELKEEYSKGLILPKKNDNDIQNKQQQQQQQQKQNQQNKKDGVSTYASGFNKKDINKMMDTSLNQEQQKLGCKLDVKTLQLKVDFHCRSKDLYEALTRIEMVTAFTQGPVKMDVTKGGEFVLFGGNIHGKFEELIPNKKISQTWRLKHWPTGHFSHVVLDIEEKGDHTELTLTQTGVPASEADQTRNNWERYYWNSMKKTFGFGSFLI